MAPRLRSLLALGWLSWSAHGLLLPPKVPMRSYFSPRARAIICNEDGGDGGSATSAFVDQMARGGQCVQDGDMGRALGHFQRALAIDPENEQTRKMVARLEALGTVAVDEDGVIDVGTSVDEDSTQP